MSLWSEYVAAALVGTARTGLPTISAPVTPLEQLIVQLEALPPERRLLAAGGIAGLWQQAGMEPQVASDGLPEFAPDEVQPACPLPAALALGRVLQGEFQVVLPEWLRVLGASGRVLPFRWLPELLDLAAQQTYLQSLILPVLGQRGRWLAARNPAWADLLLAQTPEAQAEQWQTGVRSTRLALLRQVRAADPARGRTLLGSTWSQEPAADRTAFLLCLETGLVADDEGFLESALDDRSKGVRAAAAELLAHLHGSALTRRMEARLEPLLKLSRGRLPLSAEKLKVTLPKECDAAMERDGVDPKQPSGIGERAWWLLQMVAAVPPTVWCAKWGKSPEELIRLAKESDEERVLLEGWSRAAIRCNAPDWAAALVAYWIEKPWTPVALRQPPYTFIEQEQLIELVPQAGLEKLLIEWIARAETIDDEAKRLLTLLQGHKRPWGEPLTRAFVGLIRRLVENGSGYWYWRNALPELALCAAPALTDEAVRDWPDSTPWRSSLDRWGAMLEFRRAMLESLR